MRWVKDTLPPRARARWLLITIRLSHSSFTGTVRTLVAVGTDRLMSMFCAVRMGAPRSGLSLGWSLASAGGVGAFSLGTGRAPCLAPSLESLESFESFESLDSGFAGDLSAGLSFL